MMNRHKEQGSQLVEFALVLPVILLLILGIIQFGWIFHQQIQIDNAVRLGARSAAVGDSNSAIIQDMQNECSFLLSESSITIDVFDTAGNNVGDPEDRTPSYHIRVQINIDAENLIPMPTIISLHAEAEFRIE